MVLLSVYGNQARLQRYHDRIYYDNTHFITPLPGTIQQVLLRCTMQFCRVSKMAKISSMCVEIQFQIKLTKPKKRTSNFRERKLMPTFMASSRTRKRPVVF